MGRTRTCSCGTCRKCRDRIAKKAAYDAMTPEERRAWKRRKDPLKQYVTNRRARRQHHERYPEKQAARELVAKEIRAGRMVRQPCEVCQTTHGTKRKDGTKVRVEAHHDRYDRPLEVRWLCGEHHRPPWVADRG